MATEVQTYHGAHNNEISQNLNNTITTLFFTNAWWMRQKFFTGNKYSILNQLWFFILLNFTSFHFGDGILLWLPVDFIYRTISDVGGLWNSTGKKIVGRDNGEQGLLDFPLLQHSKISNWDVLARVHICFAVLCVVYKIIYVIYRDHQDVWQ